MNKRSQCIVWKRWTQKDKLLHEQAKLCKQLQDFLKKKFYEQASV